MTNAPQPTGLPREAHILIVEDDQDISRLLSLELSEAGFRVTACDTGMRGLAAAREALARGEDADPDSLWRVLERRMGQAAQERQDFDTRADHVIREYDAVRHLAGETIQRLGRLADTLRAQRRLGAMSGDARERYARSLEEAEAPCRTARTSTPGAGRHRPRRPRPCRAKPPRPS